MLADAAAAAVAMNSDQFFATAVKLIYSSFNVSATYLAIFFAFGASKQTNALSIHEIEFVAKLEWPL